MKPFLFTIILGLSAIAAKCQVAPVGQTEITEWQNNKNGAVSITYDDGSLHQFTKALPIMERLKLPATFFVITGGLPGSEYHGKFIGRPVNTIIAGRINLKTILIAAICSFVAVIFKSLGADRSSTTGNSP